MTKVAGLVVRTRCGEVLAGTFWLPVAAAAWPAGKAGSCVLARCSMLVKTFTSRSLGESVLVLEPEEFFPCPVAGTHEGGGHAGVGPLGGMWSPAWPEPPPNPSSCSQGGTRRAGGQTVGSAAVGETEAQGPVTPTPPWPAFLVLGSPLPVQGALSGWHHPGVLAPAPRDSSVLAGRNGQSPVSSGQGLDKRGEGWVLFGQAASVSPRAGAGELLPAPIWFRVGLTGA